MGFGCWLLRHWRATPVPAGLASANRDLTELPDFEIED